MRMASHGIQGPSIELNICITKVLCNIFAIVLDSSQ